MSEINQFRNPEAEEVSITNSVGETTVMLSWSAMAALTVPLYEVIESSLVTKPIENLASSAVSGSPLWNLMLSLKVKVHFLASADMVHSLAAPVVLSTSPASLVPVKAS